MRRYVGQRGVGVWVEEDGKIRWLNPRLDLINHSPTGFEWGYGGSGPAQLALAILADAVGSKLATRLYQYFKWDVIAQLPYEGWVLSAEDILGWLGKPDIVRVLLGYIAYLEGKVELLKEEVRFFEEIANERR